jgi:hypothetical protein
MPKSDRARVSQGCVEQLADLVVEFIRETLKLREENAALRAQINRQR